MFTVKSDLGKIYIGDICYALDRDYYTKVWGDEHGFENGKFAVTDVKNMNDDYFHFAVHGTCYGDGTYDGSDGKKYSVDAGVLGLVPQELWESKDDPDRFYEFINCLGTVVEAHSVTMKVNEDDCSFFFYKDDEEEAFLEILTYDEEDAEEDWSDEDESYDEEIY